MGDFVRVSGQPCRMTRRLLLTVLVSGCHMSPREAAQHHQEPVSPQPTAAPLAAKPPPQPLSPGSIGSSDGAGASFGASERRCDGPVYLRVRNASSANFDSAQIDGIELGPVRVGAVGEYKQVPAGSCVYSYGPMNVRSGAQRFAFFPIDYVGEAPLKPGHYTQSLTTEAPEYPPNPGTIGYEMSKDPEPK